MFALISLEAVPKTKMKRGIACNFQSAHARTTTHTKNYPTPTHAHTCVYALADSFAHMQTYSQTHTELITYTEEQ